MDRVSAACEYLLELRRTQRPVAALPADVVPRSLAEGYEVQDRLVRALLDRSGGRPIGYKIACTSELAQKALDRMFQAARRQSANAVINFHFEYHAHGQGGSDTVVAFGTAVQIRPIPDYIPTGAEGAILRDIADRLDHLQK